VSAQEAKNANIKGEHGYAVYDGTSQATSLVSGAAAIYWYMLPGGINGTEIKDTFLNNCKLDIVDILYKLSKKLSP